MEEKQKALLIGVNINNQLGFNESMEELRNLAEACEIEVRGSLLQNLKTVNPEFFIGPGKIGEAKKIINEMQVDVLIFNKELSPSQLRNIEKELDCSVMDRTTLILEIFARRARTREAKLQVEVASLKYMLPRIVGSYESLERQRGGVGINNRGSGEKKLELDRRKIE